MKQGPAPPRRAIVATRLLAAGCAVALSAALATTDAAANGQSASVTIVAVGDSYASGEGAIGTGWVTAEKACHRSTLAGPQVAARLLRRPGTTIRFEHLACSGAEADGGGGLTSLLGNSGQLERLGPIVKETGTIDALTVSIGGNDAKFKQVLELCLALPFDCYLNPKMVQDLAEAFADLPRRLDAVFAAVPTTVKHVFITEYPDPTVGLFRLRCGTVLTRPFHEFEKISLAEAEWLSRKFVVPLNAALSDAVGRAAGRGTTFTFVRGISERFATHGYCSGIDGMDPLSAFHPRNAIPRFISTPVDSFTSQGDGDGSMHPNEGGHQAIGEALAEAMRFVMPAPVPLPPRRPPSEAVCERRPWTPGC